MDRHKLINWTVYVLIVLCLGVLIVLLAGDHRREQEAAEAEARWNAARQPLLARRSALQTELLALERQEQAVSGVCTAMVLFTAPDARIATEALPLMTEAGYPGMIAVAEDAFFGDAGCLTVEQGQELTGRGWGLCLSVMPQTDAAALHARVLAAGLPAPQALYVPGGAVDAAILEAAETLGVRAVIFYGSQSGVNAGEELLLIPAAGALDDSLGDIYTASLTQRTAFALTEGWVESREIFTQEDLRVSLTTLAGSVAAGELQVADAALAWENSDAVAAERARIWQANEAQANELRAELAEIEAELKELDRHYRQR